MSGSHCAAFTALEFPHTPTTSGASNTPPKNTSTNVVAAATPLSTLPPTGSVRDWQNACSSARDKSSAQAEVPVAA